MLSSAFSTTLGITCPSCLSYRLQQIGCNQCQAVREAGGKTPWTSSHVMATGQVFLKHLGQLALLEMHQDLGRLLTVTSRVIAGLSRTAGKRGDGVSGIRRARCCHPQCERRRTNSRQLLGTVRYNHTENREITGPGIRQEISLDYN